MELDLTLLKQEAKPSALFEEAVGIPFLRLLLIRDRYGFRHRLKARAGRGRLPELIE